MDASVFQRYEQKYMVTDLQRRALEQAMTAYMIPDAHGESTVCSIYYDTPDWRLIRTSLEKPTYKEKLRLRSYGQATAEQEVFLELKKKYKGVVYKRRVQLPLYRAESFLSGFLPLPEDSQIGRELAYCLQYYKTLRPAMAISYDRCAYFGAEDDSFRMTFDRNVRWRTENLKLSAKPTGRQLLPPRTSLLEIKTRGGIPLWLCRVLEDNNIRPTSFSKYGTAYREWMAEQQIERKGEPCA